MAKLAITHRAVAFSIFRYNRKTGHYTGTAKQSPPVQHTFRHQHFFSSITCTKGFVSTRIYVRNCLS